MRKFIFSSSVISAVFSGWSTLQMTKQGPRDWRLILMWVSWGLSLAIAIGTVLDESNEHRELK
ncbi:MAG: hypothetical protein H7146_12385 [Burkholderiaceae bacterium]|nr:hypothetical protein [Microbacteriaceae bacterium]